MIKRFIKYYKPHIPLFSIDMICALVVAVCNLVYPSIAREIISGFETGEGTVNSILIGARILAAVYVIKGLCQYVVGYYGHLVGVRMQADMRRDLFEKYERHIFQIFCTN